MCTPSILLESPSHKLIYSDIPCFFRRSCLNSSVSTARTQSTTNRQHSDYKRLSGEFFTAFSLRFVFTKLFLNADSSVFAKVVSISVILAEERILSQLNECYINKPTRCTFCMYLFYNFCTIRHVSNGHFVHQ